MSDKIKFKVFHNRVVVLADKQTEKSDGGIVLAETAKKPLNTGTVMAVGMTVGLRIMAMVDAMERSPGDEQAFKDILDGIRPNVGDRVWFLKHAGTPITVKGVEYLTFDEMEIVGKML